MKYVAAVVLALAGAAQDDLRPGLLGEYFDIGQQIEEFPVVAADKKPAVRRIDKRINFDATGEAFAETALADHFYVRWTGVLRVPKEGKYTFYLESDDGSRLWIGGKQVIENGGLHPMEEKSGEIELKAGDHELKVDLFENEGEVGCKLSWEGQNLPKAAIPAEAFFHKKDPGLDK